MSSDYHRELTYELRHRGMADAEIGAVLRELPPLAPEDLETEFGAPSAYAQSFPKRKRRTIGSVIITVAVTIAGLAVLSRVVSTIILRRDPDLPLSLAFLGGGILLVLIASIVAAAIDRRPVRDDS